jgi:hypothetical protein
MKPRKVMAFAIATTLLVMLASANRGFAAASNVMNANIYSGPYGQAFNEPFGAIRICVPGSTTQCQTVSGLLIDTGSFGLRIFSQALTVHLPPETSGPDRVGECAFFGSFTAWGRLETADVTLANEPKIQNLPVQVLNPNFPAAGGRPLDCNQANAVVAQSPQQMGFNGILGVGLLRYDGTYTNYYGCGTASCDPSEITQPLDLQVQNPVSLLPVDNNGVMLNFPLPPVNGAPALTGQLVFGVNTESNNQIPAGFEIYTTDAALNFTTTVQGQDYTESFIDSGSSGYYYTNPNLKVCPGYFHPGYCPPALTNQQATNTGSNDVSDQVNFAIANTYGLFQSYNYVFSDLGANLGSTTMFDWGLPFFLGRKVFVGIDGNTISGVNAPLWAYKAN